MRGTDDNRPGAVVVTGSSSGIGRACALGLDRMGYAVFAGVRRVEDGVGLAAESSGRLTPIVFDVEDDTSIESAAETVRSSLPRGMGVWGLVNNAGISVTGPLEFLDLADLRRQFEVNVVGALAVTQVFLPQLREARGRIINVGSITGRIAVPFSGPYCASKAALAAMNDALRVELEPFDVRVVLVEPGSFKTPIWEKYASRTDRASRDMPEAAQRMYSASMDASLEVVRRRAASSPPPEIVARAVARALSSRRPKSHYVVGTDARIGVLLGKYVPARVLDKAMARYLRLPRRIVGPPGYR